MEILDKNDIIVEIDKKVVISFKIGRASCRERV